MGARHAVTVLLLVAASVGGAAPAAWAHAGLTRSDPAAGAALGASPQALRLTFSERPQASVSEVHLSGPAGVAVQAGPATPAPSDPLTLVVPVRDLPKGLYTVSYRIVSAVDGHATAGSFAFGIGISPTAAQSVARTTKAVSSTLELVARWLLLVGVAALLGAAVAGVARFGARSSDLLLAAAGWLLAAIGLALLAVAQRRNAGSSFADLLDTPVGHALIWRAVALAVAGAALLVAWRVPRAARVGLLVAAGAALAAIVVHVAAGHAAAGTWPELITVGAQSAHFAAAGIWAGGLAALVLGVRGATSPEKTSAVGRFSAVALVAILVVAATGLLRAIDELERFGDLTGTGYGRAILVKVALIAAIVALGARHRRRSVPVAATDLGPLRRISRAELVLAVGALAAAAVLGTLAPPVSGESGTPPGLSDSGADAGTSVRVQLTAASAEPGPNRFVARVEDYDSKQPLKGARVQLRFTPLDDPGVDSTTLALHAARDGSYTGTGSNLQFVGRWGITAVVQHGADAAEVPLELDTVGPQEIVSIQRVPGTPTLYTQQIPDVGFVRLSPVPERPGRNVVTVTCFDIFGGQLPIAQFVLTARAGDGPTRQESARRIGRGRFRATVQLVPGPLRFVVVARTSGDTRLRGQFDLTIPR